jgi:hypothetical protein
MRKSVAFMLHSSISTAALVLLMPGTLQAQNPVPVIPPPPMPTTVAPPPPGPSIAYPAPPAPYPGPTAAPAVALPTPPPGYAVPPAPPAAAPGAVPPGIGPVQQRRLLRIERRQQRRQHILQSVSAVFSFGSK